MTNTTKRSLWLLGAVALTTLGAGAASLEHGHVRAGTRAFVHHPNEAGGATPQAGAVEASEETSAIVVEADPFHVDAASAARGPGLGERMRRTVHGAASFGSSFVGGEKEPARSGYLARGAPNPLRFSDRDAIRTRPISPALPEFTFLSDEYHPYLIESPLPEDALNDPAMLSEIVIEMDPHEVVSGRIETRPAYRQEESVERFELEEQRSTVLRPEEVLIFFETTTSNGSSGAVIPFSPATPANGSSSKSSAKLIKQ